MASPKSLQIVCFLALRVQDGTSSRPFGQGVTTNTDSVPGGTVQQPDVCLPLSK
jgi:hypothetical protein